MKGRGQVGVAKRQLQMGTTESLNIKYYLILGVSQLIDVHVNAVGMFVL